jgi:hypothetical protein
VEAEMAKDYSERTKALDDIFQRLMVSSGITPANSDTVQVLKGNQREDWAFQKQGEGQWGEGVNVTPFQYRSPAEQKILGDMFDKLYGHGANYELAGAHKNAADAAMVQAGTAAEGMNLKKKLFKILEDERQKGLNAPTETNTPGAPPNPAATAIPQQFFTGQGGGVAVAVPPPTTRPNISGVLTYPPSKKVKKPTGVINEEARKRFPELFDN